MRAALEAFQLPPQVTVRFFGNVQYLDLPTYFSACDATVLPCLADTWGLVVNESLAAGVPVLGSLYSQAVQELVEDGCNGWTFYPDDESRICSILNNGVHERTALGCPAG